MSSDSVEAVRGPVLVWTATSWALLTVTAIYLSTRVATLLFIAEDYYLASKWVTAPSAAELTQAQQLVGLQHTLYPVLWLVTALYLVGNVAWSITAARVARVRGRVLRHWSLMVRNIVLIAILVIPLAQARPSDDTSWDALRAYALRVDIRSMLVVVVQILLAVLLLAVVWFVRGQVHEMLAQAPVIRPNVDGSIARSPLARYRLWRRRRHERVYE